MITALDHIAIAVPDLEASIRRFMEDFGLEYKGREDVPEAKTSTAFFPLPPTSIELVHPLNGEGPIAKYLEKKPGGLHHLCFRTDDIDADVQRLRAKGVSVSLRCADGRCARLPGNIHSPEILRRRADRIESTR